MSARLFLEWYLTSTLVFAPFAVVVMLLTPPTPEKVFVVVPGIVASLAIGFWPVYYRWYDEDGS